MNIFLTLGNLILFIWIVSFNNEDNFKLDIELTIKDKSEMIPVNIKIIKLANDLVQIKSNFIFSRTNFKIGINQWSNTTILKDKIKISINLFLFRE